MCLLMDTRITHAPLIEPITEKGLFVIGMVKQIKQNYRYDEKLLKLDELFNLQMRGLTPPSLDGIRF
jgi:hypothetical protein